MALQNKSLSELLTRGMVDTLAEESHWLAVQIQEAAEATAEDCFLCGGLLGAALFPGMTSMVSQEAVADAIDEHDHYKHVYRDVLRVPAHTEQEDGTLRIVPDDDQPFVAEKAGSYRLAALAESGTELAWVEVSPVLTAGSTLSSLGIRFGS